MKRSEASQALTGFVDAYNAADKAYDPALDKGRVAGALGAINQAGLRSNSVTSPGGNPQHRDLVLQDPHFSIPKKAGWPRWFVADAAPAGQQRTGADQVRWIMAFVRESPDSGWKAAYLTSMTAAAIPRFATDADGYAVPAGGKAGTLAVPPARLSADYAEYLRTGSPDEFAPGPHTDQWRAQRAKSAKQTASTMQYIDQPLKNGEFTPLALATKDGGAFVFFATRYYQRQTTAAGYSPQVPKDVVPLMQGTAHTKFTKEWVSSQAAEVPASGKVSIVSRLEGVTGATGS
ncbi:hypothetical protein [Streptomyces fuscigenes]|uniref:hypothetical protein n=1 Tax=Streptomyces fuscigenes TaxID=1528880 RepID=UPI0027E0CF86|nr:hypothetical protein [Streptomyces fuscigenes]